MAAIFIKLKTIELDNTQPLHKFFVFNRLGRIRTTVASAIYCFNKCFTRYFLICFKSS